MTRMSRACLASVGALLVAALLGCGSGASSVQGSSQLGISNTSLFVTVENLSGQPLVDVHVAIKPYGVSSPYATIISRMETGEKRDLSVGEFRGADGTGFSLRLAKPQSITVTATDLVNKKYEATRAWQ